MERLHRNLLLASITICLFSTNGWTGSLEEESKLKEKCGKNAKEFFNEQYGPGISRKESGPWFREYANHYNLKLHTCFLWVREAYSPKNKSDKGFTKYNFYDVNKNVLVGSLIMDGSFLTEPEIFHSCSFLNQSCHSKSEWENLIKPYMEE